MNENSEKSLPYPIGLMAVIEELNLRVPLPSVRSKASAGVRKTLIENGIIFEQYPKTYWVIGLYENLKFAMRYEPIDLGIMRAAFEKIEAQQLEVWISSEKTSIYARKIWYLYELLTENILDISDVPPTGYVDLLNPKLHFTGKTKQIQRQRINDNLLGNRGYCPMIRRTETLEKFISQDFSREAKSIIAESDPIILARAVNFLYTKETKSSFAIEGEKVGKNRAERFVTALTQATDFNPTAKESFVSLQNSIVDSRYVESDWRILQNFVGQTMRDYSEQIHFVTPKPEDVEGLMKSWMEFVGRLQNSELDAVCAAAAMSFGFVFIHPFEDGNGRIHRFLIHHELARRAFAPPNFIFPISAVMLRERVDYDRCLETFSSSILPFIDYSTNLRGEVTVENETADLYRYWDATAFAEFLYRCVAETINRDLTEELNFLQIFDSAMQAVREAVDMPDRKASLLVRFILQNRGALSQNKRNDFIELSDEEISVIEKSIREISVEKM
ncbi:MAG: Fic family protein [Acidobacteriota bacterium]|nr:Fic family protein [Acidobacteriota bacterium]